MQNLNAKIKVNGISYTAEQTGKPIQSFSVDGRRVLSTGYTFILKQDGVKICEFGAEADTVKQRAARIAAAYSRTPVNGKLTVELTRDEGDTWEFDRVLSANEAREMVRQFPSMFRIAK